MDKKTQTINTYDNSAEALAKKFDERGARILDIEETLSFIKTDNPHVFEIGCGNGRDALEILKRTNNYLGEMNDSKNNVHVINETNIYFKSSANMTEIESDSVNLIITSPPYWTLKDYKTNGQIGLGSNSYEHYIEELNKAWKVS